MHILSARMDTHAQLAFFMLVVHWLVVYLASPDGLTKETHGQSTITGSISDFFS